MPSKELTFTLNHKKDTPGTRAFEEPARDDQKRSHQFYLPNWSKEELGNPKVIEITVRAVS